jgi:polynucleotide 5'-hydroxyl-kinase GRC3/NOL9
MTDAGLDVPSAWRSAADRILDAGWRTTLIIGETDAGKSTLCRYLCRRILEARAAVAVVDADIGQKDIGPPATVTLGFPDGSRPLAETPPDGFYFVGSTNPIRGMVPLVIGVARLARAAERPFVLVDTPGAVRGPGQTLQGWLIETVRPDIILAIESGRELAPILDAHRHLRILPLPRSPEAKRKSTAFRAQARARSFARYFAAAKEARFDPARLVLQRAPRPDIGGPDAAFAPNRLCGVADRDGACLGLAILQLADPDRRSLTLLTPVPPGQIAVLQFGDLRIDRDGRELREDGVSKRA